MDIPKELGSEEQNLNPMALGNGTVELAVKDGIQISHTNPVVYTGLVQKENVNKNLIPTYQEPADHS